MTSAVVGEDRMSLAYTYLHEKLPIAAAASIGIPLLIREDSGR